MRVKLFISLLSIIILSLLLSPTVSYSGEDQRLDEAFEYLDKVEDFVLQLTPEDQKERVRKMFKKLREFLRKELGIEEKPGAVEETMLRKGLTYFRYLL